MTRQVSHDQVGLWYAVNASKMSCLRASMMKDSCGSTVPELYIVIVLEYVEIEGDGPPVIAVYMMGQCGVVRGIMSRSRELSGMFRIAVVCSTLSIIGGWSGVGHSCLIRAVDAMCMRVPGEVGVRKVSPSGVMNSFSMVSQVGVN